MIELSLMNAFCFWIIVLQIFLFVMLWIPYGINWTVGRCLGWDALQMMLFRMGACSGEVRISYTFVVILSFPVPEPKTLW